MEQEKKNTEKQQKRDFKLGKTLSIFDSMKSKQLFNPVTGITSIGVTSYKKMSKLSEDIEKSLNPETIIKKEIPSPAVALNKRVPQKSTSKSSSKKSSKKKKEKRVPRKYEKPNITKSKLSNRSVHDNVDKKEPLLEQEPVASSKHKSNTNMCLENLGKSKSVPKSGAQKAASRFTAGNIDLKDLEKHGIILEDQNESCDNSSSDEDNLDHSKVTDIIVFR